MFVDMDKSPVETIPVSETLRVGAEEAAVLATAAQTGGDLFAVELRMPPGGGPPVMHRHAPSEVYRVLSGEFTFYVTGEDGVTTRRTARAGETVTLAGNTPHTVRNESSEVAVAFCVHAPGAVMEGFSRAAAALAAAGTPTMEDVLGVARENGIELLGPVPA
jgi:mannose-6-phosphate isomerase-like protein (cupin superfamily)